MRERAVDVAKLPSGFRARAERLVEHGMCRHCRQRLGPDIVTPAGFMFHAKCVEVGSLEERVNALPENARVLAAPFQRLQDAKREIAKAKRWRGTSR